MDLDSVKPEVCRWHMDATHTTDRCFTFKKFLTAHKTANWYDLSGLEETAMGLGSGNSRYVNKNQGFSRGHEGDGRRNHSCTRSAVPRREEQGINSASQVPMSYVGAVMSQGQSAMKQMMVAKPIQAQAPKVEHRQKIFMAEPAQAGAIMVEKGQKVHIVKKQKEGNPTPMVEGLNVATKQLKSSAAEQKSEETIIEKPIIEGQTVCDKRKQKIQISHVPVEIIKNGPPIAQFLDAQLLCPKCKPIAVNRILITQMCSPCCVNYFLRLVQLSTAGALLITPSRPCKEGNYTPKKISSANRPNSPSCTTGYDPCSGKFVQVKRRLDFSGVVPRMLKIPNPPVGLWQTVEKFTPMPSAATKKRKERRLRRTTDKRAKFVTERQSESSPQQKGSNTSTPLSKSSTSTKDEDASSGAFSDYNPLDSGTPSGEGTTIECNTLMLPVEFARGQSPAPRNTGMACAINFPVGFPYHWFEKPTEHATNHLHSLHIEARFDGSPVKRILVDNGATVNVLPLKIFKELGYGSSHLTRTDVTVSGFNGRTSNCLGIVPVQLRVGQQTTETAFFVIDIDSTFNALLGRDWLHKVAAIPSTLHQELLIWNDQGLELIKADSSFLDVSYISTTYSRADKPMATIKDLSFSQRYKLGDPTIGPLGEANGKFEFLVSYEARPKPNLPIIPTGWVMDEELVENREAKEEKQLVEHLEEFVVERTELSPLEIDMVNAGIAPLVEGKQSNEGQEEKAGTELEPDRLLDEANKDA